jgi:hypothetical protein
MQDRLSVPSTPRSTGREPRISWRSLLIGAIVGIVAVVALGVVVIGPMIVGHRQDLPLEKLYGDFAVSAAARANGGSSPNPLANNNRAVSAGRNAYVGS